MRFLGILICLCCVWTAHAQWSKINEVSLEGIEQYDQDQLGNFYVTTISGDVKKYNAEGNLLTEYSPVQTGKIHQLDATTQLKVLAFYEDLQEYVVLDRYLRSPARYNLRDFGVGFVSDIALNYQMNVWIVDQTDFTLKLLDALRSEILQRVSLAKLLDQQKADIYKFQVHQNKMYLVDKEEGILIFDSIGNFVSKQDLINGGDFRLYHDHFYFSAKGKMYLRGIYSHQTKEMALPDPSIKKMLYNGSRLVHFSNTGFVIYKYLSSK